MWDRVTPTVIYIPYQSTACSLTTSSHTAQKNHHPSMTGLPVKRVKKSSICKHNPPRNHLNTPTRREWCLCCFRDSAETFFFLKFEPSQRLPEKNCLVFWLVTKSRYLHCEANKIAFLAENNQSQHPHTGFLNSLSYGGVFGGLFFSSMRFQILVFVAVWKHVMKISWMNSFFLGMSICHWNIDLAILSSWRTGHLDSFPRWVSRVSSGDGQRVSDNKPPN